MKVFKILSAVKYAYKKPYGYYAWPLSAIFLLLILFICLRVPIFTYYLNSKIDTFNAEHHAEITYQSISFKGFSGVELKGFSAKEKNNSSLLLADLIKVKISFWKLFSKRLSIEDIKIDDCKLNIEKNGAINNYDFLLKKDSGTDDNPSESKTYSQIAESMMDLLFDVVPNKLNINRFTATISTPNHHFDLSIPSLDIHDHQFMSKVFTSESGVNSTFISSGRLDKKNKEISIKLYGENFAPIKLPWIEHRNQATVSFDTLNFRIKNEESPNEQYKIGGSLLAKNLHIFQKRIATDTVTFEEIGSQFIVNIGSDFVEFDSASTVTINQLNLHPYAHFTPKTPKKIILSLYKPMFPAQQLFNSLPKGLFDNFKDIKVSGELSYQGYFELDMALVDSLKLKSDLIQKQFKIIKPGATDFAKINGSFTHTIYENDKEFKKVELGPANPNFISFEMIPKSIINGILMSEDGSFFNHGGFSLGAFRESIITNIKTKRFARGGSTVSMQLVKNLFLNRKKNIARKLEELLIVWVLEKNRLASKERMFEIYVNIIEWGPGIYGLQEASNYYFDKKATQLTLEESIFLTAIIPSPKNYRYFFNDDFSFKEYAISQFNFILKRMVEHELISQSEADATLMKVTLSNEVKEVLISRKTKTAEVIQ